MPGTSKTVPVYTDNFVQFLSFNLEHFVLLANITIYACKTGLKEEHMERQERH